MSAEHPGDQLVLRDRPPIVSRERA